MHVSKLSETYLIAKVNLGDGNYIKLTNLPGYRKFLPDRTVKFKPTGANIAYILEHWPEVNWSVEARPFFQAYMETQAELEAGRQAKLDFSPTNDEFSYKTQPYEHQRRALHLSKDKANYALFMEQGTGKTKVIIDNAGYLFTNGKIDMMVVIAPNGVHENWAVNELPKHAAYEYVAYVHSTKNTKKTREALDNVLSSKCLKVVLINVEGFTANKAKDLLDSCLKNFNCMLVIDESSRIKNPSAKRTRYLISRADQVPFKRILSGTPVTNGIENLYSQFLFLDQMILGFNTYTTFKHRYCIIRAVTYGEMIVGYQNEAELIEKLEGCSFRVLKSECLDLPEKIYKRHPVQLSPNQRKVYDDLVQESLAEFEGEEITADLAIVKLLRLQQVVCGWFPTNKKLRPTLLPLDDVNPRIKALQTILEDVEGKVIIWCRFVADLEQIYATLRHGIKGQAILYRRVIEDVNRFQNDPEIKYFIANPAMGGLGLTLTAAETVIYYSNSFDLEHRLQSEDRSHRIGTKKNVVYVDIQAQGTVDGKIITALRNKKHVADAILQDPTTFFLGE